MAARDQESFNRFVQQVVDFYGNADRTGPKTVQFGGTNGGILGTAVGNQINVNPDLLAKLQALYAAPRDRAAMRQGIEGLGTLIHEALHARGGSPSTSRGLYPWDDEWQAHQLSYNLVPDAMQRFFGVDANSDLGNYYQELARGRGYGGTLGGPGAAHAQGGMPDRVFYL